MRPASALDSAIHSFIDPAMAVNTFYNTNSATIKAAWRALSDVGESTGLGRNIDNWMGASLTQVAHRDHRKSARFFTLRGDPLPISLKTL